MFAAPSIAFLMLARPGLRGGVGSAVPISGAWLAHENGTDYFQLGFELDEASNPTYFSQAGPQASGSYEYLVIENRDTGTKFKVLWGTEGGDLTLVTAGATSEALTDTTFTLSSVDFEVKLEGSDAAPTFVFPPV